MQIVINILGESPRVQTLRHEVGTVIGKARVVRVVIRPIGVRITGRRSPVVTVGEGLPGSEHQS